MNRSIENSIYIFQVNNVDVTRMECTQVVPLLSSSPDELTLVVGRRPAPMFDEMDELFDVEEDEHQRAVLTETSLWNSSMNNTTIHENTHSNQSNSTMNNNGTATNNNSTNTFTLLSQSKTSTV